MTRAEILAAYVVKNGRIVSPGQFEGESIYAPHFWESTLDGTAEELAFMEDGVGQYVALVEIDSTDRAEFPEIPEGMAYAVLTQSDSGFISCELCSTERADEIRAAYGPEDGEEDTEPEDGEEDEEESGE